MDYKEIPAQVALVDRRATIDLYIRIKGDFRLFAAKGAVLTEEQFQQFSRENTRLYIKLEEFADAQETLDAHFMSVLTDPEVNPKVKADIVYSKTMRSIQDIFEGISQKTISELKKISGQIVRLILADSRVLDSFIPLQSSDQYTFMHSLKVGVYSTALSIELFKDEMENHRMDDLSIAFFLHDIGMTRVPASILNKKEPFTDGDWETIRMHPVWGLERLKRANYESDEATQIVLYHHERCDGTGYPFRKTIKEIPVYARICAIADTFEILTSGRMYGSPQSPFKALGQMHQEMAKHFDPELLKAFILMLGPGK